MRLLVYTLALVGLVLSLMGCHGHDDTEVLQAQALALHDSILVVETQINDALAQVTAQVTTQDDSRQLARPIRDSLAAIWADLVTWNSYVIEPPGGDHDGHDHAHGHAHDHAPPPDMTPQQMVEVQQALLDEIRTLQARLEQLDLDAVPASP